MNLSENKVCLSCAKALKGRMDKKFCDDYCRNNYNNHQKPEATNYVRNVINTLRRNRNILQNILGNEEMIKTTRDKLLTLGFRFKYHTHHYENKKGGVYVYCFDMGYLALENDWFLVVRREEY